MNRQQKTWALLVGLLVLWGFLLWDQFGGSAADAEVVVTVAATPKVQPEDAQPQASPEKRMGPPEATAEIIQLQQLREAIPWGRNPFARGLSAAAPNVPPKHQEPRTNFPRGANRVSSILLSGNYRCAIIDGARYVVGDSVPGLGVITAIHERSIELTGPKGSPRQLLLQSWRSPSPRS